MSEPRDLLRFALHYSDLGYAVFPCVRYDKRPLCKNGFKDATHDPEQLQKWFANDAVNIAISTEGILVVDIDTPSHEWTRLPWPDGPVQRTPRGGWHRFFKKPKGIDIRCSAGVLAPGIDIRTCGGYALLAPSYVKKTAEYNSDGTMSKPAIDGGYTWSYQPCPKTDLPDAPGWLIDELRFAESRKQSKIVLPVEPSFGGDNFNDLLDWWTDVLEPSGWKQAGHGANGTERYTRPGKQSGVSATVGHYQARDGTPALYVFSGNVPELPANHCYDKLGAFARLFHGGDFRAAAAELRERFGLPTRGLSSSVAFSGFSSGAIPAPPKAEWPAPPHELAFHGPLGEYARFMGDRTEANSMAILVQAMALFGNLIGREPRFRIENKYLRTNLFTLIVGRTSLGRKGTSLGIAQWLFKKSLTLDGIDERWSELRSRGGLSSGEGLLWQLREPNTQLEDPGEPDKRLCAVEEEFATVLANFRREGNTLSQYLRQLADSPDYLSPMTKSNVVGSSKPHFSLIGHIVPGELQQKLTSLEIGNGLVNRFLIVCSQSERYLPFGSGLRDSDIADFQRRLSESAGFAQNVGEMSWHPAARPLWESVYPSLRGGRQGMLESLADRAPSLTLRMAMIFALLDRCSEIHPEHLMATLAVWDYSERSLIYLFGDKSGDALADELHELLMKTPGGLTRTELQRHLGNHGKGEHVGQALAALLKADRARVEQVQTDGRPAERWYAIHRPTEEARILQTALAAYESCDRPPMHQHEGKVFLPPVQIDFGATCAAPRSENVDDCERTADSPPAPLPDRKEAFLVGMLRNADRMLNDVLKEAKRRQIGNLGKTLAKLQIKEYKRGAIDWLGLPPSIDLSRYPELDEQPASIVDHLQEPAIPTTAVHPGDEQPPSKKRQKNAKPTTASSYVGTIGRYR